MPGLQLAPLGRVARPPRIPGFDYLGLHQYFLTICASERQKVFRSGTTATVVIEQIRHTAHESGFAVLAYCVMPDHLHLLVEGRSASADLRRFIKRAKQRTGRSYSRTAGVRLWQEGYYDRVLRRDEDARAVARYIVENPVRAGLVNLPHEYPHMGSDIWSIEELMDDLM